MAITTKVQTQYGENRELYIRLNNIESSNHGVETVVKFRGFLSKKAFEVGSHYMWEKDISFIADINLPLWPQSYKALKKNLELDEGSDC